MTCDPHSAQRGSQPAAGNCSNKRARPGGLGAPVSGWPSANDAQRGTLRHFARRRSRADLPDLWFWAMNGLGRSGKAPSGYPLAVRKCEPSSYARATAARSQFWSQLSPFVGVRERSTGRFASVNGDVRIGLDLGLRIWKAGWVHALAGSNPASSVNLKQVLTCGNAVRIRSAGTASHQTSRRPVSILVSVSGRRLPEIRPSAVQACSPPFADVRLA